MREPYLPAERDNTYYWDMVQPFVERPTLHPRGFNFQARLPYGLRVAEIRAAMEDLYDFLHNVNRFLTSKGWDRLEEMLSAAGFSGLMSELVVQSLSKHSASMTKNKWHNGRPDLVPRGVYPRDAVLAGDQGIEVKASRYGGGWQGHNVEPGWIMIFQYQIDLRTEPSEERKPTAFQRVLAAELDADDWRFSGRGPGSRRTITASILSSGLAKLEANAVYVDPAYAASRRVRT